MKRLLQISILVLTVVFISSCTGNDGDPGPSGQDGASGAKGDKGDKGDKGGQGEPGQSPDDFLKSGSISGTISGVRRDKTAFEETFKYEYLSDEDGFNNNGLLTVSRSNDGIGRTGYIYMQLEFTEKNNPALPIYIDYINFDFSKELSPSQLFLFNTSNNTINSEHSTTAYYPLLEDNDIYQIDYSRAYYTTTDDGTIYYSALTDDNSFVFYTLDGNVVHYDSNHGVTTGNYRKFPLLNVTDAAGNEVEPGAFEGTIYYYKIAGSGSYIEDKDGNNLSGEEIWDFSETVSDYHYNSTTGVATFNYSITIPAPLNTSGRAATLSGSAEVKVYSDIMSRVASGN